MKKVLNFELNTIVEPFYQTVLICITSVILFLLTLGPVKFFKNFDSEPQIFPLSNISANKSTPILTGLYLRNFLEFDVLKNEFIAEGVVWFIYDPKKVSSDLIKKFSITKGEFLEGEFLEKDLVQIQKLEANKELAKFNVRIKFSSNLNYKFFPLDSHRLYIVLNNKFISAKDAYFDVNQSQFVIPETLFAFGWKKVEQNIKTGYTEVILDKENDTKNFNFPRAIFSIDFMLTSLKNILLIFLPLFVVFFLSIFLFALDPRKYREPIITISAATVPAILAYRFVIETISPKVTYFILSDHIFNLFLILCFFVFVGTLYFEKIQNRIGVLIIFFHLALIFSWAYLLYVWPT